MTGPQLEESGWFRSDRPLTTFQRARKASAPIYADPGSWAAKRRVPNFDDLLFLAAVAVALPLEGYRERCSTKTLLGTRCATRPIELAMPITVAGMSFGALSAPRVKRMRWGRLPPKWVHRRPPATAG